MIISHRMQNALSTTDRTLEIICLLLVVSVWAITLFGYASLPAAIPIHFSITGEADIFDDKAYIWLFPTIISVLYVGLTTVQYFPQSFNYTINIDASNAEQMYRKAIHIMRIIKASAIYILAADLFFTIHY